MGTDSGLSRFDGFADPFEKPEDAWRTFTTQTADLPANHINGLFVDGHGPIWISTPTAVTRFMPNLRPPETQIVRAPRSTVGTDTPFFEYRATDMESKPDELLYAYKVDNGEWSPYSKRTFVTLSPQSNGVHTFFVRAMDKDGNVDSTPAQRSFRIDITPPTVTIDQPAARGVIGGQFEIRGDAFDETDFARYTVMVKNEANGEVFRHESQKPVENHTLALWDTTTVPDGIYTIVLTATDRIDGPDDEAHTSQTEVPLIVDNTIPAVRLTSPQANQTLAGEIAIIGEISDKHLSGYRIEYSKDATSWIQIETQRLSESPALLQTNWNSASVGGPIVLRLVAIDKAGNENADSISVNLNNKNPDPIARIEAPAEGELLRDTSVIRVQPTPGMALRAYILTLVKPPTVLRHQTENLTHPDSLRTGWETTRFKDGEYTLQLETVDSQGLTWTHEVRVKIDNTPPRAEITSPRAIKKDDGNVLSPQVGSVIPIIGTATDTNFKEYIVEVGAGSSPQDWQKATTTQHLAPVEGKELITWLPGNRTGVFTLRLTVTDMVDHKSTASVTVDIQPPMEKEKDGHVTSSDGRASLSIPRRSLQNATFVTINPVPVDELQPPSDKVRTLDVAYDIGPVELELDRRKPATLQIQLDSSFTQSDRRIAFFQWEGEGPPEQQPSTGKWMFLGGTVQANQATVGITEPGRYALMEVEAVPELPGEDFFTCQPRVFSPGRGEKATILFNLTQEAPVTLKVYNLDGRLQRALVSGETMYPGRNAILWDGRDEQERDLYHFQFQMGRFFIADFGLRISELKNPKSEI